jgi:Kelch motif
VVLQFVERSPVTNRAVVIAVTAAFVVAGCASGAKHAAPGTTSTRARGATGSTSSVQNPNATPTSTRPPPSTTAGSATAAEQQRYEPALPVAIQEAAAAVVGDRMYVVGGYDTARNSSAAVFVGNGTAWQRGPSLPIAVNHPGAASIDGDVYVAGGFTPSGATNRAFVLAAGSNSWRELAPMRRARGALALVALGGQLYAIGGRDRSVQIAVPERYDPSASRWADLPPVPAARNHVGGYVDGGLVCVAGGRTPDTSAAIDCFDPPAATWTNRATLPTATSGAAAAVVDGVTVVAGGEPAGETRIVGVVQALRLGTWSSAPMLVPRHGTAFAIYHERLWACGGATAPGFQAVATCTSFGA